MPVKVVSVTVSTFAGTFDETLAASLDGFGRAHTNVDLNKAWHDCLKLLFLSLSWIGDTILLDW